MASARMKELLKKYGKVGLGVHLSISAASTAALYAAIKNNVDVESLFHKFGLQGISKTNNNNNNNNNNDINNDDNNNNQTEVKKKRNRTAELAASSGGAVALALLCNKALFPVRVPITLVLTPPLSRFLAKRQLIKNAL